MVKEGVTGRVTTPPLLTEARLVQEAMSMYNDAILMDVELMAIGDRGVHMDHVTINVVEVFKNDSVIVIIPPPPMVVVVVLDTPKWLELAIHKDVQVGQVGDHGEHVLYRAMVVSVSGSETVRKDTVPDRNRRWEFATFTDVAVNNMKNEKWKMY